MSGSLSRYLPLRTTRTSRTWTWWVLSHCRHNLAIKCSQCCQTTCKVPQASRTNAFKSKTFQSANDRALTLSRTRSCSKAHLSSINNSTRGSAKASMEACEKALQWNHPKIRIWWTCMWAMTNGTQFRRRQLQSFNLHRVRAGKILRMPSLQKLRSNCKAQTHYTTSQLGWARFRARASHCRSSSAGRVIWNLDRLTSNLSDSLGWSPQILTSLIWRKTRQTCCQTQCPTWDKRSRPVALSASSA